MLIRVSERKTMEGGQVKAEAIHTIHQNELVMKKYQGE